MATYSDLNGTTQSEFKIGATGVIQALAGKQNWHGFPSNPYEVILSYDASTRQVTLTPTGSTFDIWLSGVKYTKTGAQSSTAHANTTGNYFIYYDANAALQVSSDLWDILGAGIPVCYVYYNSSLSDGVALFELHTAKRNPAWHKSQHFALGTYIRSGLEIADYTLNSDVDANLTYSIASGIVVDEDIEMTVSTLADNGPYTIIRRTGANEWTWTTNNTLPFLAGTYIQYNQYNTQTGLYQMTDAQSARWVNYFVFATTAIPHTLTNGAPVSSSNKRFLIVPSQTIHTSLALAQAESLASINWTGILIPEIVGAWKWTYEARNTFNSTGKVRAVEVSRLTLTRSQLSGNFTAGSHNALTGRDAAESHPASAISNTAAGNIAATDVQAAINELDSEKQAVLVSGTNIKTVNSTSLLGSGDVAVQPTTNSLTEINADLVDSDEVPVYDASATANRKSLISRIWTYISGKLSTYLASPPAIGGTTPAAGSFTTVSASSTVTATTGMKTGTAGEGYPVVQGYGIAPNLALGVDSGGINPAANVNQIVSSLFALATADGNYGAAKGDALFINQSRDANAASGFRWAVPVDAVGNYGHVMRLTKTGTLLVNTVTDDASGAKLQVNGAISVGGTIDSASSSRWRGGADFGSYLSTFADPINYPYLSGLACYTIAFKTGVNDARVERLRITADGNVFINTTTDDASGAKLQVNGAITLIPGSSVTPTVNNQVTFELTNNTTLKIKAKGSDGTVRSVSLTLA